MPVISGGRNTEQGEQRGREALRLSCLHVLGARAAVRRRDWSVVVGQEPSKGAGQVPGWRGLGLTRAMP